MLKKGNKKKEVEKESTKENIKESEANPEEKNEMASTEALVATLSETFEKRNKFSNRLLIGCFSFLIFLFIGYGFMGYQLTSRISGLNESAKATGTGLDSIKNVIETLTKAQSDFVGKQTELTSIVEKAGTNVTDLQKEIPDAAAKRISVEADKITLEVSSLKNLVTQQTQDVTEITEVIMRLNTQLDVVEQQLSNAKKLNVDVAALVTLEREKYLTVLKRQADLQERQSGLAPIKVPRDPNMIFYSIGASAE
jgi:hypothetical protein